MGRLFFCIAVLAMISLHTPAFAQDKLDEFQAFRNKLNTSKGTGKPAASPTTGAVTSPDDEDSSTFVVTPEQFRAMALIAVEVVAAGRPICPRCGLPEDPDDHRCPSVNGHHG